MSKKKSKSSTLWLNEHHNDIYVQKAKKLNLRSRAHFKLEEIQQKINFIKPGLSVIDLGASPGAWSVLASQLVGVHGTVISCDLLPMNTVKNNIFIQGDFNDLLIQEQIIKNCKSIDIVLSDIAPNTSGIKSADQLKAIHLAEMVLNFSIKNLAQDGSLLIKLFHGEGFDDFIKTAKLNFNHTKIFKPLASRNRSSECYLFASLKKTNKSI